MSERIKYKKLFAEIERLTPENKIVVKCETKDEMSKTLKSLVHHNCIECNNKYIIRRKQEEFSIIIVCRKQTEV